LSLATVGDGYDPERSPLAEPFGGSAVGNAACTKAVVASWVVFVLVAAVGATGVPVNVGDTMLGEVACTTEPEPVPAMSDAVPVAKSRNPLLAL
jgi:hypothetical protein